MRRSGGCNRCRGTRAGAGESVPDAGPDGAASGRERGIAVQFGGVSIRVQIWIRTAITCATEPYFHVTGRRLQQAIRTFVSQRWRREPIPKFRTSTSQAKNRRDQITMLSLSGIRLLACRVSVASIGLILPITLLPAPANAGTLIHPENYDFTGSLNNIDTRNGALNPAPFFAMSTGGVALAYSCRRASGDISNTRIQIISRDGKVEYRGFDPICDDAERFIGYFNTPANTGMSARLHVYSNGRISGKITATTDGYWVN
jgi:hypothetical protein